MDVEELSAQTGISVRNLRFYTTRGLVPPPTRQGRSAVYGREHVARFQLLRDLQAHGLNLAAIERYFRGIPDDASAEQIALHRVTVRPVPSESETTSVTDSLIARGIPAETLRACGEIYERHGKAVATELEGVFRESLWPAYRSGELEAEDLVAMLDDWEQTGSSELVAAFNRAITETRLAIVARRSSE